MTAAAAGSAAWHLPPLREDLNLLSGAAAEDGAPTWLIYDALRHKYFKIGLDAFRLLGRWRAGVEGPAFVAEVQAQGLAVEADELKALAQFLVANQLTRVQGAEGLQQLQAAQARRKQGWLTWLLHHYLFIRIPLWRPDHFLARTLPLVAPLFNPKLLWLVRSLGLVGVLLVLRQWEQFSATFLHFFSLEGLFFYGLTLAVVKSAHELGHAYAARRQGCRVASMGVALLVLFPMLYTDTTDAWRLRGRRQRLSIVLAGVSVELHLAMLATFAWSFLPEGPLRSVAFFVATTSWLTTVAINLSPFMRFDGYFALADLLGAENLQPRAFALARWHLRESLFGLKLAPPEVLAPGRARLFIAYAYATWVYRFFLFVGIALLVYHYAFKLLGLLLFAVEIGWFIMLPLKTELQAWAALRGQFRLNRQLLASASLCVAVLLLMALPWRPTLAVPAVLESGEFRQVFPPERARLGAVKVRHGQTVAAGEVLMQLEDPALEQALSQARRRQELQSLKLQRRAGSADDLRQAQTTEQQMAEEQARVQGLLAKRALLQVRAPIAGTVHLHNGLEPGQWLEASTRLADVRGAEGARLVGYLPESMLQRLEPGAQGRWIGSFGEPAALRARLGRVDTTAVATLAHTELASDHGGPIAVRAGANGALRPEQALYRVEMALPDGALAPPQRVPGVVHLQGKPRSLADETFTAVTALLIKEGNF